MTQIATIGLDLAKSVFQVHGVDGAGERQIVKKLRRSEMFRYFASLPPCTIGVEACGTAHYWARELRALGHDVKLIPPNYVKPYVRRGKNDAADAAAICEAVTRPSMRFVPVKSEAQQSVLMLHAARDMLVGQRTQLANAIRAHLAELGVVAVLGNKGMAELVAIIDDATDRRIPPTARAALAHLVAPWRQVQADIAGLDAKILEWHQQSRESRLLATIPGIGVLIATKLAASIGDASYFRSGRELSAWLGLVPRQNSSGGKERLGGISKQGNGRLRSLLVVGATSALRYARARQGAEGAWVRRLMERRPPRVATVALANKMARIAWAVLTRGTPYRIAGTPDAAA